MKIPLVLQILQNANCHSVFYSLFSKQLGVLERGGSVSVLATADCTTRAIRTCTRPQPSAHALEPAIPHGHADMPLHSGHVIGASSPCSATCGLILSGAPTSPM
jgi:hypothetical protein